MITTNCKWEAKVRKNGRNPENIYGKLLRTLFSLLIEVNVQLWSWMLSLYLWKKQWFRNVCFKQEAIMLWGIRFYYIQIQQRSISIYINFIHFVHRKLLTVVHWIQCIFYIYVLRTPFLLCFNFFSNNNSQTLAS